MIIITEAIAAARLAFGLAGKIIDALSNGEEERKKHRAELHGILDEQLAASKADTAASKALLDKTAPPDPGPTAPGGP